MRRSVTIQVLLALAPAVYSAPFLHLHGHASSTHFIGIQGGQTLAGHTHLGRLGCGRGERAAMLANHDDDDEVSLSWFQDHPRPVPGPELVLTSAQVLHVPQSAGSWTSIPVHRSHDPPFVVPLSLRSPPAGRRLPVGA